MNGPMTCQKCRFFFILETPDYPQYHSFQCRRHSPITTGQGWGPQNSWSVFGFPTTAPDSWCGEFQEWPKVEEQS